MVLKGKKWDMKNITLQKNLVIYNAVQKHLAYNCYTVHLTLSVLLVWQNLGGWCTNSSKITGRLRKDMPGQY